MHHGSCLGFKIQTDHSSEKRFKDIQSLKYNVFADPDFNMDIGCLHFWNNTMSGAGARTY